MNALSVYGGTRWRAHSVVPVAMVAFGGPTTVIIAEWLTTPLIARICPPGQGVVVSDIVFIEFAHRLPVVALSFLLRAHARALHIVAVVILAIAVYLATSHVEGRRFFAIQRTAGTTQSKAAAPNARLAGNDINFAVLA